MVAVEDKVTLFLLLPQLFLLLLLLLPILQLLLVTCIDPQQVAFLIRDDVESCHCIHYAAGCKLEFSVPPPLSLSFAVLLSLPPPPTDVFVSPLLYVICS